jgi:diguanylate cyclase (GGDEF)-like protein
MLIMLANQAGLAIENSVLYEQTLVRSHTDSLTGLWNHGYFQSRLHTELEKTKANNAALSIVMIDIDDFKVYNDTLGHQLGDKILKELAKTIKDYSRNMDYVCRYGGEEFVIIMSQTSKKEAFTIAEKLREIIERQPFPHEEILPNKRLTVSIGIAAYPEDGTTASSLIDYSDKLLYEAKNKGKNIICY